MASIAVALVGLLALPSYTTSYDDKKYLPADVEANIGYAAAERHFPQARLNPEVLMLGPTTIFATPPTCSSSTGSPRTSSTCPASPESRPSPGRWVPRSNGTSIPYHVGQQGVNQKLDQSYSAKTARPTC